MAAILEDKDSESLLKNLEERVSRLEVVIQQLQSPNTTDRIAESATDQINKASPISDLAEQKEDLFEMKVGQFWLAKIGVVVLTLGIASILILPFQNFPSFLPSSIGFVLSLLILSLSKFWNKDNNYMMNYLVGSGIVTLFISVLRLHFFSTVPVISSDYFLVILSLLIVTFALLLGIKKNSQGIASLGLILLSATALISNISGITFLLLILLATSTVLISKKFSWSFLFWVGIFTTYISHLIWYLNNPFLGNEITFRTESQYNIIFLLSYLIIFSLGNLSKDKNINEDIETSSISFINCALFDGLFIFVLFTSSANPGFHLLAAFFLITISVIYWTKQHSKYSTFLYSMSGYLALSIAIVLLTPQPEYYFWLGLQSVLVVSTAIWFKSKIIVVANFLIFITIILFYLVNEIHIGLTLLSFGIIALVSARILNWMQMRLELKTEQMRNIYLLVGLLIIPYALYRSVNIEYVSFTWIALSISYYILSILLKTKKYRWMALITLLLTVGYSFILGLSSSDTSFKIISFLSVGIALIITSVIYSRKKIAS